MKRLGVAKTVCVGLSCLGLILPTSALDAAPPAAVVATRQPTAQPTKPTLDVELDAAGTLRGQAVNVYGAPAADREVLLRRPGSQTVKARTDVLGRFSFGHLRGGTYQVTVEGHSQLLRVWAAQTSPPVARRVALVVVGSDVVRGQMPLAGFFASDAVVVTGMVAAMIVLPIAIHNSGHGGPASP